MSEGEVLGPEALPSELAGELDAEPRLQSAATEVHSMAKGEAELIRRAIAATRGNLTQAARELDIAKSTLYQKVKQYGLERDISRVREATPTISA